MMVEPFSIVESWASCLLFCSISAASLKHQVAPLVARQRAPSRRSLARCCHRHIDIGSEARRTST